MFRPAVLDSHYLPKTIRLTAGGAVLVLLSAVTFADNHDSVVEDDVAPDQGAIDRTSNRVGDLGSEGDDVAAAPASATRKVDPIGLWFYGSGRIRTTVSDGELRISDNRSRVGIYGYKFLRQDLEIFSRIELGTDLGGQIDDLLVPPENPRDAGDGSFFLRVGFVGVATRWGELSVGKQWSTYYDVSGFTDRFAVFGATASGTYNAGTDGGGSGTGRVDRAVKYEGTLRGLSLGLQLQGDGDIPRTTEQYDGGGGASLVYKFSERLSAAAAYNVAFVDQPTPELIDTGLTGDSTAVIIGLKYEQEPFYVGATWAQHENHETTNEFKFIDADGLEIYSRYQFSQRLRAVAGYNYLDPDAGDPNAGEYKIESVILGLQFTYRNRGFGDIIYIEADLRNGRQVDGTPSENAYTVGIRYSFEL